MMRFPNARRKVCSVLSMFWTSGVVGDVLPPDDPDVPTTNIPNEFTV